jgi:hypothetical protein
MRFRFPKMEATSTTVTSRPKPACEVNQLLTKYREVVAGVRDADEYHTTT